MNVHGASEEDLANLYGVLPCEVCQEVAIVCLG